MRLSTKAHSSLEYLAIGTIVVVGIVVGGPIAIESFNAMFKSWDDSSQSTFAGPFVQAPPKCVCTNWQPAQTCATGSCLRTQRERTRTCTPSGCKHESECLDDNRCCTTPQLICSPPSDVSCCGVNARPPTGPCLFARPGLGVKEWRCGNQPPQRACLVDNRCTFHCLNIPGGGAQLCPAPNNDWNLTNNVTSRITQNCSAHAPTEKCIYKCPEGTFWNPGQRRCEQCVYFTTNSNYKEMALWGGWNNPSCGAEQWANTPAACHRQFREVATPRSGMEVKATCPSGAWSISGSCRWYNTGTNGKVMTGICGTLNPLEGQKVWGSTQGWSCMGNSHPHFFRSTSTTWNSIWGNWGPPPIPNSVPFRRGCRHSRGGTETNHLNATVLCGSQRAECSNQVRCQWPMQCKAVTTSSNLRSSINPCALHQTAWSYDTPVGNNYRWNFVDYVETTDLNPWAEHQRVTWCCSNKSRMFDCKAFANRADRADPQCQTPYSELWFYYNSYDNNNNRVNPYGGAGRGEDRANWGTKVKICCKRGKKPAYQCRGIVNRPGLNMRNNPADRYRLCTNREFELMRFCQNDCDNHRGNKWHKVTICCDGTKPNFCAI